MRLYNTQSSLPLSSWCKLEVKVDSPKKLIWCNLVTEDNDVKKTRIEKPPPLVVTVSLTIKIVVNEMTQKSEVVSDSNVCHNDVLLNTASHVLLLAHVVAFTIRIIIKMFTETQSQTFQGEFYH